MPDIDAYSFVGRLNLDEKTEERREKGAAAGGRAIDIDVAPDLYRRFPNRRRHSKERES